MPYIMVIDETDEREELEVLLCRYVAGHGHDWVRCTKSAEMVVVGEHNWRKAYPLCGDHLKAFHCETPQNHDWYVVPAELTAALQIQLAAIELLERLAKSSHDEYEEEVLRDATEIIKARPTAQGL